MKGEGGETLEGAGDVLANIDINETNTNKVKNSGDGQSIEATSS